MSEESRRAAALSQASPMTIGLALCFAAGVFAAGVLFSDVLALNKLNLPSQLALIRADLYVIKKQLGISTDHQSASNVPAPPADATLQLPFRPPLLPRRAAAGPE